MPIYSKPVRALMKEIMSVALAPNEDTIFTKQQAFDWFAENYPKIKTGTITAHLIRLSTNAKSRTHYSAKPEDDDVFFQIDGNHYRLYRPSNDPFPINQDATGTHDEDLSNVDDIQQQTSNQNTDQFAYERDLQNFLVKNLNLLEHGLRLYEDEGIKGIEFPAGGRFIDILAIDKEDALVVIELKVSRGYDRVVGQLMRYMAWIGENQADNDQHVRGMIIANEISKDLVLATSLLNNVQLFEYQLSLSLKQVERT